MQKNIKLSIFLIGFLTLFCSISCSYRDRNTQDASTDKSPWVITIENWKITNSLKGTHSEVQYDGNVKNQMYEQKPNQSMSYFILGLLLKKQAGSTVNFSWKDVYIQDFKGAKHYRLQDDGFLEFYGFQRIKGVDLTFGEYQGSICFELPQNVTKRSLTFVYETPAGKNVIHIK